ncbi:MEDS domain-containing protein [Paenisporosarcina sp.]|uniref:MEDS domain-containing protein n=1 Tax=Paenisporosarcina sp. TaxID=1932001 RepID=UPI003C7625A0
MDALYKSELEKITEGHIFYSFENKEAYLNNLISFILSGIENQHQILIIESMRYLPIVRATIDKLVSVEHQSTIRVVNNYEYYLSSGDFNTYTILTHFANDLSLLKKENSSIRTWAHVEWASSEPDAQLLMDFELSSDDFVLEERMLSVCAYSTKHLTSNLSVALEQSHKYVMTDETLSVSTLYKNEH